MLRLRDFVSLDLVKLELDGTSRDEILRELVSLLALDEKSEAELYITLRRQQNLGSTGIGRGVAVVYYHTTPVSRVCVGFGRRPAGVDFRAIDGEPVHYFFLVLGRKLHSDKFFLPALGAVAQIARAPGLPDRLRRLERPEEFLQLLDEYQQLAEEGRT